VVGGSKKKIEARRPADSDGKVQNSIDTALYAWKENAAEASVGGRGDYFLRWAPEGKRKKKKKAKMDGVSAS